MKKNQRKPEEKLFFSWNLQKSFFSLSLLVFPEMEEEGEDDDDLMICVRFARANIWRQIQNLIKTFLFVC